MFLETIVCFVVFQIAFEALQRESLLTHRFERRHILTVRSIATGLLMVAVAGKEYPQLIGFILVLATLLTYFTFREDYL